MAAELRHSVEAHLRVRVMCGGSIGALAGEQELLVHQDSPRPTHRPGCGTVSVLLAFQLAFQPSDTTFMIG